MRLEVVFGPLNVDVNVHGTIGVQSDLGEHPWQPIVQGMHDALEARLRSLIVETAQEMRDQYDALRMNVANQIQQLADALAGAGNNQAAIDDVTAGMRDLNAKLIADDPIPPVVP